MAVIAWLVQRAARRELSPREAWLRSTLLALSPGWIGFAHATVDHIDLAAAITLALPAALIAARLGALGVLDRDLLSSPGSVTGLVLIGMLALVAALRGWLSCRREVQSLAALAAPYRHLQQQPVQVLAQAAHRRHGSARVLDVVRRARCSVVTIADLPTIFGSPRRPASPRPDSSFLYWTRHRRNREALVLGSCRAIETLGHDRSMRLSLLERRQTLCLASPHARSAPAMPPLISQAELASTAP